MIDHINGIPVNRKKILPVIIAVLLLWIIGCKEQMGPARAKQIFAIENINILENSQTPPRLNLRGNFYHYTIIVKMNHPQGSEGIDGVTATFLAKNQQDTLIVVPLFDDGGALHPKDGDIFAKDNYFTNRFSPRAPILFPLEELYIQVTTIDVSGKELYSQLLEAETVSNPPPILHSVTQIPSDSITLTDSMSFSAVVSDSMGIQDIQSMEMQLIKEGLTVTSYQLSLDSSVVSPADTGTYTITIDSSFAVERQGSYTLQFQAIDSVAEKSAIISKDIYLNNTAPVILSSTVKDTVTLPIPGETTILEANISVDDPQGLADIEFAQYTLTLIGGVTKGPFTQDTTISKGKYNWTFRLEATNKAGVYVYKFTAKDRVGNFSEVLNDTILVKERD